MFSAPVDIIGNFTTFEGVTPKRLKCMQFRKGSLDFSLECIQMLQNDFSKQRYITLNATVPGQDKIYPNTHLCRNFLLGILITKTIFA